MLKDRQELRAFREECVRAYRILKRNSHITIVLDEK